MASVNPSFNTISQFSHVGWGYLLTTLPVLAFHFPLIWVVSAIVLGAGIKEYSDSNGLETPDVAGNSWEDFGFWCIGIVLAVGVLIIK